MFTEYFSWYNSIQKVYQPIIQEPEDSNSKLPVTLEWLLKGKNGTENLRIIYSKNMQLVEIITQVKWKADLMLLHDPGWQNLCTLSNKCKLDARIRFFNWQIIHRTIMTRRTLFLCNIIGNEECGKLETISHMLYECTNKEGIRGIYLRRE